MCKWGTDAIVTLAHPLPVSGPTEVAVDACLAPLVQLLNDYGVHTTGCCCGHGQADGTVLYQQDGQQHTLRIAKREAALLAAPAVPALLVTDDLEALTAEIEAQILAIRGTRDIEEQRARVHHIGLAAGAYFAHRLNERRLFPAAPAVPAQPNEGASMPDTRERLYAIAQTIVDHLDTPDVKSQLESGHGARGVVVELVQSILTESLHAHGFVRIQPVGK